VLLGGNNFVHHRFWLAVFLLGTLGSSAWYFHVAFREPSWPGGSSLVGFTLGVAGGVIILFEMLLWVRKKVRSWRIIRARSWLVAHIWLGLLTVPLLVYHSGFQFGGLLSTVLAVLFLIVIASGIYGLILQQYLPSRMLHEVPAETIASQVDVVMNSFADEAAARIDALCGTPGVMPAGGTRTVGVMRSAGAVQGKVLETLAPIEAIPGAEPLRTFFVEEVSPYLRRGPASGSTLRFQAEATRMFQEVRGQLPAAAHDSLANLEVLCEQRRQVDLQANLHWWLHSWLCIHLPLSVALCIVMVAHVFVALKYW
jgi:hypothetical protein